MASGALVLVSSSYPEKADGTEAAGSFVADLVEELARHLPVRVVAPGREQQRQRLGPRLEVFRFKAPPKPLSTLRLWVPGEAFSVFSVLSAGESSTREAVGAGKTAHILALWALPCGFWAKRAARHFEVPYSVWTLGSDIWSLGRIPVVKSVLADVLLGARRCYSDGHLLRTDTERIAGREAVFLPSTRSIGSGMRPEMSTEPPYVLTFIGRWHPNKGVDLLLDALSQLDAGAWRSIGRVEIHGGGPMQLHVEQAVGRLVAEGHPVVLGGFVDKNAAAAILDRSDFVLIPSRIESIPVVFSDAMKMGCPVISMPVGDLPGLVADGPVGTVASQVTAAAFAGAISAAVSTAPAAFAHALSSMAAKFSLGGRVVPQLIKELDLESTP